MKRHLPVLDRSIADARVAQTEVADAFQRQLANKGVVATCKIGCDACCHQPFKVPLLEGLSLYQHLRENGLWTTALRERVTAHANRTINATQESWELANQPCPLLVRHECIGYSARPTRCRLITSIQSAELCHPHGLGSAAAINVTPLLSAVLGRLQTLGRRLMWKGHLMPLSEALLIAEAIDNETLDYKAAEQMFLQDYARAMA